MSTAHPVRMLNAEVARKIAAGEVIDRPNAIVRELMDNAIDSGADSVTVEINGGGIDKVRIDTFANMYMRGCSLEASQPFYEEWQEKTVKSKVL